MKTTTKNFKSFGELISLAIQGSANDNLREVDRISRNNDIEFHGTASFEDAVKLATQGWEEGRKIIQERTKIYKEYWEKFFPRQDYKLRLENNFSGEIPDVSAYIQGHPESMMSFVPDDLASEISSGLRLQRIIINGTVSCYVKLESILIRGALIGALVNSMELLGINCEISVAWSSAGNTQRVVYSSTIKQFQDVMDLDKLAFSIAHSSMLRRFILSLIEQENDAIIADIQSRSYGYPKELEPDEIINFGTQKLTKGNMYVKLLDGNYTEEQLINSLTEVVKLNYTEVKM